METYNLQYIVYKCPKCKSEHRVNDTHPENFKICRDVNVVCADCGFEFKFWVGPSIEAYVNCRDDAHAMPDWSGRWVDTIDGKRKRRSRQCTICPHLEFQFIPDLEDES